MSRLISVRRTLQLLKSIYPILRPPPPPPFGPARALCSSAPTSTSSRVRAPQVPRLHGPRRLLRRRHLLLLPLLRHRQAQEGLALPLRTLARRGTSQRLQQEHHPRGPHPPLPPARVSLPARVRRPGCPQKCREDPPCWVGLSPNGIGLSRAGMVNLALMDKVLEVEKEKKRVRVEAGIRVQELVDGIKEFGLTLQKFASIREQQMGGIVQVGALATGTLLPPIDEQIIAMKSVTPAKGTIEVSKVKDPELFYLARCGLGSL